MPMTTRCARASSPRSNASCSTGAGSRRRPRRACAVFAFIEGFYNPRRRHSSIGYLSPVDYERRHQQSRSIPTHTILPPCSRPSRTSPSGGRQEAAVLDRRCARRPHIVRAGTEEWLRRGPNKRMARNRRTTCRQIRYPDPKPSPVHETGASPPRELDFFDCGAIVASMGRAELFIWLACVLVAKQLFPPWVNSASPFIDALVAALTNRSAFYYLAWYAVFRLLYESDRTAPSTGVDVVFALVVAALNFLSPTSISSISATAIGVFLLATSQEDRKFQAAAAVLFALAFNGLWGPLVFDFFAFQLLQADATLVGGLLSLTQSGMSWSQTIVGTLGGHSVFIYNPCSSFHNISLGLLCWVTVTEAYSRDLGG